MTADFILLCYDKIAVIEMIKMRRDTMGISEIMSLLSGVALFLFGMSLMGDG